MRESVHMRLTLFLVRTLLLFSLMDQKLSPVSRQQSVPGALGNEWHCGLDNNIFVYQVELFALLNALD